MRAKMLLLVIFAFIGLTIAQASKAPEIEWSRTFGGKNDDGAAYIQQTTDEGYILVGGTKSYASGGNDVWLIKTDSQGREQWSRTFGGAKGDEGHAVRQTRDGGYIIVGGTNSYGSGGYDVWLIKTDSQGREQWNRTFGGKNDDYGSSVYMTNDGGYMLAGVTDSFLNETTGWVIKADSKGDEVWDKIIKIGEVPIIMGAAHPTEDGGLVLCGAGRFPISGSGPLIEEGCLIKLDSKGNIEWGKRLYGDYETYILLGVVEIEDGSYVVTGSAVTDKIQAVLTKTDSQGNQEWLTILMADKEGFGYSLQQTSDGGYIVTGYVIENSTEGSENMDVFVIKTDCDGKEEWNLTLGEEKEDIGAFVLQTSDGGYAVLAGTESYGSGNGDAWLIKLKQEQ